MWLVSCDRSVSHHSAVSMHDTHCYSLWETYTHRPHSPLFTAENVLLNKNGKIIGCLLMRGPTQCQTNVTCFSSLLSPNSLGLRLIFVTSCRVSVELQLYLNVKPDLTSPSFPKALENHVPSCTPLMEPLGHTVWKLNKCLSTAFKQSTTNLPTKPEISQK